MAAMDGEEMCGLQGELLSCIICNFLKKSLQFQKGVHDCQFHCILAGEALSSEMMMASRKMQD